MMKWNKRKQRVTAWILLVVLVLTDTRCAEIFRVDRPSAAWADTNLSVGKASGSDAQKETEEDELLEPITIPMEYILTDMFTIVLEWAAPEMAEGTYRVYMNGEVLGETEEDMFETEELEPGETYEYQVEAIDFDGNVTGMSEMVLFQAPDVLKVTGRVTLQESQQAYALSIAKDGILDLNGYSVRTYADSEILGTLELNEGALYQRGNLTFSSTSELVMTKANDYLEVTGDLFLASTKAWKQLTKGRMNLYGDFWQETQEGFIADGTHRVILKGEQEQLVKLASGSQFAILELENSSEEGVCFTDTLIAKEFIDNDCFFQMGQENHYYGRKLEEDTLIAGDYVLMGGELDLNGYELAVEGDFIHASGKVVPNAGVLYVGGDYLLGRMDNSEDAEEKEKEERYQQGNGSLLMEHAEDRLEIDGNFYFASKTDHRTNIADGEMRIGGDLRIGKQSGNGVFQGTGNHLIVLNGEEDQQLDIKQVAGLRIEKEEGMVVLNNPLAVTSVLNTQEVEMKGSLILSSSAKVEDQFLKVDTVTFGMNRVQKEELSVAGDLILSGGSQWEAPIVVEKNVIVEGNITQKEDLHVGQDFILNYASSYSSRTYTIQAGVLEIEGDFTQDRAVKNNYAYLAMPVTNTGGILIHGDMWYTTSAKRTLAGGVLEAEGNVYLRNISTSGEFRMILSGTDYQEMDVDDCSFALIELNNHSEEGIWSPVPIIANTMITNGCILQYGDGTGDFGWTLAEDEVIVRDVDLVGETLDLNGHHLTIQGNFTHSGGTIVYNGGTLTVEGDYTARSKQQMESYTDGVTIVKGDFLQEGKDYINFKAASTHELIFSGTGEQRVSLEGVSKSGGIEFGNVTITNTSTEGVVLESNLYVAGELDAAEQPVTGTITLGSKGYLKHGKFGGSLVLTHVSAIPEGCEVLGDLTLVLSGVYGGTVKTGKNLRIQGNGSLKGAVEAEGNLVVAGTVNQQTDVTVGGNFEFTNGSWLIEQKACLNVTGNVSSGTTGSSYYSLRLNHPEALVMVGGNLTVRGGNFTQGRIELKRNGTFPSLRMGSEFVLCLSGTEYQVMTVTDSGASLGILELQNTSEAGVFFSSMVEIGKVISNGCRLQIGDLEGSFGWQLTDDLECEELTLIGGVLDLNGYHLKINGNLIQSGGTVDINGGCLEVTGDYQICGSKTGESSRGRLLMEESNDQVLVNGDFLIDSSVSSSLTQGVLNIDGNFTKKGSGKDFVTGKEHTLLFSGRKSQTVTFERSVSGVTIANLEVDKTSGEVELKENVVVITSVLDAQSRLRGNVTIRPATAFSEAEFVGNVTISGSGELESALLVKGNLTLSGTITVKEEITVNGNLTLSGTTRTEAKLIVSGTLNQYGTWYLAELAEIGANATIGGTIQAVAEEAYFLAKADILRNSNSSGIFVINQGALEIKGNLGSNWLLDVKVGGDGVLIMSGTRQQHMGVTNTSQIQLLKLHNTSAEGVNLLGITTIEECEQNGVRLTYLDEEVMFGWSLSEDQSLPGDVILFGGTLDLQGHQLEIEGDFIQLAGRVRINQGTLLIGNDYRMQSRSKNTSGAYQYSQSNALVEMKQPEDKIQVGGDFHVNSKAGSQCTFTDGILELKGDYWQYNSNITMSGEHTTKFSGNTRQYLYGVYNYIFGNLVLSGGKGIESQYSTSILTVNNSLTDEAGATDGKTTISVKSGSNVEGGAFSGNLRVRDAWELDQDYQIGGTLELQGKTNLRNYTIRAKNLHTSGYLEIEDGEVFLSGNLLLQQQGTLVMEDDGYVLIRGNLLFNSNNSKKHILTGGTIELCGNLDHVGPSTFESGGTHQLILAGKQIEPGRMYVQQIKGTNKLYFNCLVLRRREELYEFSHSAEDMCQELIWDIMDDTAPATPVLLRSPGQSETTINLIWRENTEEDLLGYEIYRNEKKVGVTGKNVYTDMGLTPETQYRYRITAFDENGNTSSYSSEIMVRTRADVKPPTAPGTPWISQKTGSSIEISWLASKDEVGVEMYEILRGGEVIGETRETIYTDYDVTTDVLYTYQIIAVDAAGNRSEPGEVKSSTFAPKILEVSPAAGSSLSGKQVELKVIFADWGNSKGNRVTIEYRHKNESEWYPVHNGYLYQKPMSSGKLYASYPFAPEILEQDGEYQFRYTLYDAQGNEAERVVSYIFDGQAPKAPENLWASTSQQVIDLGWDISESGTCNGYRIYRRTQGKDWRLLTDVSGRYEHSYRDGSIEGNQEYQYQITSYNEFGRESIPGNIVTIVSSLDTWPPSIIEILPKEEVIGGTPVIKITGTDNRQVKTIRMEYRLVGSAEWIVVEEKAATNNAALFFWDTRLLADGEYEVQAFATDGAGNESAEGFSRNYIIDNTGPAQVVISEVVVGDYSVQIRWLDTPDEDTSYFVLSLYEEGQKIRTVNTGAVLGASIGDLEPEKTYEVRVTAYDRLGNPGEESLPASFTTNKDVINPVIRQVGPMPGAYQKMIPLYVAGSDNHGLSKAVFSYSMDEGESWVELEPVMAEGIKKEKRFTTSFDVSNLPEGKILVRFEVYDIAGNHNSPLENGEEVIVEYEIDRQAPEAPANLRAQSGDGFVLLTWDEQLEEDLAGYEIYRCDQEEGIYRVLKTQYQSRTYYDTTAKQGASYQYYVCAMDQAGNRSEKSQIVVGSCGIDNKGPNITGIEPLTQSIVGANPQIAAVAWDEVALASMTLSYRPEGSEEGFYQISSQTFRDKSGCLRSTWDTTGLDEGRYEFLVTARDQAGNDAEPAYFVYSLDLTAPAAPKVKADSGDLAISLEIEGGTEEDFKEYEIWRRLSEGESDWKRITTTKQSKWRDTTVEGGWFYDYKVFAYDLRGNYSESEIVSALARDVDLMPPNAQVPEYILAIAGKEVVFDGGQSTDNKEIASYDWDFGDLTSADGVRPIHTYDEPGVYPVLLEVTDSSGNVGQSRSTVEVFNEESAGSAQVQVQDRSGKPIPYAWIYIKREDGSSISTRTDGQGNVSVAGTAGVCEVAAYMTGYLPSSVLVHLSPYTVIESVIMLEKGDLIVGDLTVERMELEEMIEAGVDFSNPSNYHRYKFRFTVILEQSKLPVEIEYIGGSGGGSYTVGGGWGSGGGGGTGGIGGGGGGNGNVIIWVDEVKPEKELEEDVPVLAYVTTTQTIEWMKEMYNVELGLLNAAAPQYVIEDTYATLNLPDGLSLAALTSGTQSETIDLGSIAGQEQTKARWIVRGDKSGSYQLSADVRGMLSPFGAPVSASFTTEQEFTVQTGEGLHLYIKPQSAAYLGENYYIQFELRNESDRNLYNLTTSFGEYTWEEEKVEWLVKDRVNGGEYTVGSQIDEYGNRQDGAVFVRSGLNNSSQVTMTTGGDSISVGVFGPGDVLYGTYYEPFMAEGNPDEVYYTMVDYLLEELEGENLGVKVSVVPIQSHIFKGILELRPASVYGDPVDVTTGAFVDEMEALSVTGGSTIGLDLSYNSLQAKSLVEQREKGRSSSQWQLQGFYVPRADAWKGELGIGFSHGYETHIYDDLGVIELATGPGSSLLYVSEDILNHKVYGKVNGREIILDETAPYEGKYFCQSAGMEQSIIEKREDGTYVLYGNRGDEIFFDAQGRMTSICQLSGKSVSFSYGTDSMVVRDNISGKTVTYYYNSEGLVSYVADENGRRTTLTYEDGFLTSVTDPLGQVMNFSYEDGLMSVGANGLGEAYVTNTYDEKGRVTSQVLGGSESRSLFAYQEDRHGTVVKSTVTDHLGNLMVSVMDAGGRLLSQSKDGETCRYEYNKKGQLVKETTASGNVMTRTYDSWGNIATIRDSDGSMMSMSYDRQGNLLSITDGTGGTSRSVYNAQGNMTENRDALGQVMKYTYDTQGNLLTEVVEGLGTAAFGYTDGLLSAYTDRNGYTTRMEYNGVGDLVRVTEASGAVTHYTYDAKRRMTGMTDALGNQTRYEYNEYGQIAKQTDVSGAVTTGRYDTSGQLKEEIYPDGTAVFYDYDAEGRVIKTRTSDGRENSYSYDVAGNLVRLVDAEGSVYTYGYGPGGYQTSMSNPLGHGWEASYSRGGLLEQQRYEDGSYESYRYNGRTQLTRIEDASGAVERYEYDSAGNITRVINGLGHSIRYEYDRYGRMVKMTDPRGGVTTYGYDAVGNCTEAITPGQAKVAMEYNHRGQVTTITSVMDGEEYQETFVYDVLGRLTARTDAEGYTTHLEYDVKGNVTGVIDALGQRVSTVTYDSMNRAVKSQDALGIETSYGYDSAGNLVSQVEAGLETRYGYDKNGRLLSVTDSNRGITSQTYDVAGNIRSLSDPMGGVSRYEYDSLNRLVRETNALNLVRSYSYNTAGRLECVTAEDGSKTYYQYNLAGFLTEKKDDVGQVNYTYDENGNVLTIRDEQGTIRRTYDVENRMVSQTDVHGRTITYGYDQLGNVVSLTYPGGEIIRYAYYKNGWLKAVSDRTGTISEYTYDGNGRVLTVSNRNGTKESRSYDGAGRLITLAVTRTNGAGEAEPVYDYTYGYDERGNITSLEGKQEALSAITQARMEYDQQNRLIRYNGETIRYDERGNMVYGPLAGVMTDFTYDKRNRLVEADGTRYTYDGEDNRIGVETAGYKEEYVIDRNAALSRILEIYRYEAEVSGFATVASEQLVCVYGAELILEKKGITGSEEVIQYHHYDQIGSTMALTNEAGVVLTEYSYGAYGELTGGDETLTRFRYNGGYGVVTDENGLYYMRARYYNVDIRRFVNQDILRGTVTNSQSLNRYSYVQGNPVSYSDPFGLSPYQAFARVGHQVLDLIGFLPLVGDALDLVNVVWYGAEALVYGLTGNSEMALRSLQYGGLSLLSALPGIGSFVGQSIKLTIKGVDVGCAIVKGSKLIGYGYASVTAGYGAGMGAIDMVRKYGINKEKAGWHTVKEAGTVTWLGAMSALSGKYSSSAVSGYKGIGQNSTKGTGQAINPNDIRFSQSSVNGAGDITDSMKKNGWVGDPIDVVKMPDGNYTTIDNTRVAAARQAGIDVQANVHNYNDSLPSELIERFTTKKGTPTTWGEALELRIGKQNATFRKTYPLGSFDMPKLNEG